MRDTTALVYGMLLTFLRFPYYEYLQKESILILWCDTLQNFGVYGIVAKLYLAIYTS